MPDSSRGTVCKASESATRNQQLMKDPSWRWLLGQSEATGHLRATTIGDMCCVVEMTTLVEHINMSHNKEVRKRVRAVEVPPMSATRGQQRGETRSGPSPSKRRKPAPPTYISGCHWEHLCLQTFNDSETLSTRVEALSRPEFFSRSGLLSRSLD
ncbi:predicted protein [Histoplasma capsulatum var. duboisii H88]|uniref:Predicted protein n=2 Tax=Ajellomyces capsulatus TaxID=5037 RepID=F0U4L4_AJEC8|nr:predicted protein [Histoplasma capsulatum H143]EGC41961.1 predicted protein [Histoplasma capsulatum var. duboisii H88]